MIKTQVKKMYLTAGSYELMPCELPASLYSVLIEAGKMKDPYHGCNIETVNSGVPSSCSFMADVELSVAEASSKHVYLYVRGVHAIAEIYFNGRRFGQVSSPDRVSVFDVADLAEAGRNTVEIKCLSPLHERRILRADAELSSELEMAPYLADMGIAGDIELVSTNDAVIKTVRVNQNHDGGRVTLRIGLETYGDTDDLRAMATLLSPSGKIYFGGISNGEGTVIVPDPELWWPNGLGNHLLYKLTVTLYHGEIAADSYRLSIGLRDLCYKVSESGVPYVTINGVRMTAFGATYVNESSIYPNIDKKNTERLIAQAVEAKMNTLRVVSEGSRPSEAFYELCDKNGLLVWQDISVPYVRPPVMTAFAAGISDAVRDTVSLVTVHSCVALTYLSVLGEVSGVRPKNAGELSDFRIAASNIITPMMERYGNGVAFVNNPSELFSHDEKYIKYDHGELYEAAYPALPSVPELASIRAFADNDDINLAAPAVELHCNCRNAVGNMLSEVYKKYRFPNGMQELSYVSALAEALDVRDSVLYARSRRNECASSVCRQLNDGWPAISPAGVDYYGRIKAVMYLASSFYAPTVVIPSVKGATMTFEVSNEARKAYTGKLIYILCSSSGETLREGHTEISVDAFSNATVAEEDFSRFITSSLGDYYVSYELSDEKGVCSSGIALFVTPKRYAFSNPTIRYEITGSGKRFAIKLMASSLAIGVKIGFDGIDAKFTKNYVDVTANTPVMIGFDTAVTTTVQELQSRIVVNTVWSIGR